MDFKVTYLDAGLTSAYFNEGETPNSNGSANSNSTTNSVSNSTKVPKRYKAHHSAGAGPLPGTQDDDHGVGRAR